MPSEHYEVRFTKQAEKDIADLRPWMDRVLKTLNALKQEPLKGHALRGSLAGVRSLEFSLPGGAQRAVYVVLDEEHVCLVFLVGAHEGIYEKAERRAEGLRRQGTFTPAERTRQAGEIREWPHLAEDTAKEALGQRADGRWEATITVQDRPF